MSHLHVWVVVRLLPNLQHAEVNRFRRRGDAENYLRLLKQYNQDASFVIVFDPPPNPTNPDAHSKNSEKSGVSASSSRIDSRV
jgi:hypothetical protein